MTQLEEQAVDTTSRSAVRVFDGTSLLTLFVVLLVCVPSRLVVGVLGAAGSPAQILAAALALWWGMSRLSPNRLERGTSGRAIGIALAIVVACVLASYVAATTRPIIGVELRSADRGLLSIIAWSGLLLVAMDGIASRERLDVLLRRLVLAAGALATLALVQFVTGMPLVDRISIPGLSALSEVIGATVRSGFTRPAATAIHPIEFGVVLTLILPVALHFAMRDHSRTMTRRWWPVVTIAAALSVSLSRSALIGAILVLVILLPSWAKAERRRAYVFIVVLLGVVYVAVPGMLGTLTGLFTGIAGDGSALSRTNSYDLAWQFIERAPVVGRGFATFLPSYRILDNQFLGILIELGFVGLVAFLSLFGTAICSGIAIRRRMSDPSDRSLALAMTASVAAASVGFATFDAFGFPMVPSVLFIMIGCIGALDRLSRAASSQPETPVEGLSARWWSSVRADPALVGRTGSHGL